MLSCAIVVCGIGAAHATTQHVLMLPHALTTKSGEHDLDTCPGVIAMLLCQVTASYV